MYHHQIEEVADIKKSYQWLENAGLTNSTEALIMAAQEQVISTRAIETRIYQCRSDPRCKLCKEARETIHHIVAGCKMLAGSPSCFIVGSVTAVVLARSMPNMLDLV